MKIAPYGPSRGFPVESLVSMPRIMYKLKALYSVDETTTIIINNYWRRLSKVP